MQENMIQKGFVFSIALLFFGTSTMGIFNTNDSHPVPVPILGTTLYVGGGGSNNYTKMQDAIDNASDGDTILVYPGTYYEDQITVDKAVTIEGGGLATTFIDGGGATLASCGLVRIIANGDVTFQGFTVQHAGGPPNGGDYGDDLTNIGIYAQSDSSTATYTISDNKILGTNNPDDWEDYGFYTNSGQEHLIFTQNIITQTAANSILIEKHLGSTELSYNTLDAGCWGIDPIYCMTYAGTDITTLQKISHNVIDVSTGIHPQDSDNKVTGIGFSSAYLGCTGSDDSGKYTNIEISYNTINNLQAYERGIALDNFAWDDGSGGEISNAVIQNNIINGISTTPTSFGIRLSGLVSSTIIRGNTITGCDMSFWGTTGFYGDSTAYPTGTIIRYNNFADNGEGLVWEGTALLIAEDNWWGDASGPQASGNPDGTGDPISGNVDYTSWLLHPYGPPYAAFDYTIGDLTVTFDASASGDYDGTITTYEWNFGDTTTGDGKIVGHTYSAYQTYTATLTVTDNNDKTDSISQTFTLSDHIKPVINNIQAVPNPQHDGGWVNISCKVADNVAVSLVKVHITYPDSSTVNQTMTYNTLTHLAVYNITYSLEGFYDYFIWASDTSGNTRISSVHSFEILNHPPNVPGSPTPSNGATDVDVNAMLSWVGGDPDSGDTVTYDVFFGTSGSPPKVVGNQSGTTYDPVMGYSTMYYWKIVAWDDHGASATGSVWHFTTMAEPNDPPYVPNSPDPANGTSGVNVDAVLTWVGGDPDSGDTVTYDVYFGTLDPPGIVVYGQSATSYDPVMEYSTTYYWKIVAWDDHGSSAEGPVWHFTTEINNPPVFGTPTPSNGSTDKPLSLTWSIPISDPEGDSFDWTIQCSNGQTSGASGASNGTKTLSLSGLSYATTYKVWVNATDPAGSGLYTRRWYTFHTKASLPPVFGTPDPTNNSMDNPLSFTWSIPISDPEGDLFSWSIQCSNGQTSSANGASNGTKTLSLSGLSYSSTYKVWVNATDPIGSGLFTRKWYDFTTKEEPNDPPNVPSDPRPPDGATNVSAHAELSWTGGDPDPGDTVTYDVYFGTTSSPPKIMSNQSGTSCNPVTMNYHTKYYWKIVAWDNHGASAAGPLWSFTTESDVTPPFVEITNPLPGYVYINLWDIFFVKMPFFTTIVIGKIDVTAFAYDNESGVNRVEFWLDTDLKSTDYIAPYNWTWSERGHFFPYTLKVVAYDNAGNHNQDELKVWKIL
jgi:hypothetical protein